MADITISTSDCGYTLYKYKVSHGQYIPVIVIEIPLTQSQLQEAVQNGDSIYISGGSYRDRPLLRDFGITINLPYWNYYFNTEVLHAFLEAYTDEFFTITVSNDFNVTVTFKDSSGDRLDGASIEPDYGFAYGGKNAGGQLVYALAYHTTDDFYAVSRYWGVTIAQEGLVSIPVAETSKGVVRSDSVPLQNAAINNIVYITDLTISERFRELINASHKFDENDPNNNSGDSNGNGGGGTDDIGGNTHTGGTTPTISPLDSGLMTLYSPSISELQSLGRFLWSDSLDLNTFKKLFNDPFDTLLGLSIVPIKPTISGTHNIIFGNLDSGVSSGVVANPWVDVECGSLTLNEVWHGALDYSPYTQVSIYLPFIGVKQLNTNDVMGSTLALTYHFDVLTGSCIAEIAVNHTSQGNKGSGFSYNSNMGTVYTFSGQCSVNVPLASLDYTNTIRAAIEAVGFTAGAAASFAAGHPALGIASLAVGTANAEIKQATPVVERSGSLGLSSSFMASLEPCLIVSRSHICKPEKYYSLRGVPSQVYVSALSKASGFIQIADTNNLKVSGANDTELTEIKNLLTQGVYVKTWRTKKEQETLEAYSDLDVQLYNNKSAKNQIDKSLSGIRSGDNKLSGTFRDSCDFDNPVVQLRINDVSDLDKCNYMYIGKFNRYYYVTKIVSMRNHIVEISGHVDVLMTYEYYIGTNEAILARSSQVGSGKYGNTYLDDSLMASYNDTYNVCYNWGYSFDHANDSLILAVAGASQS